MDETIEPKKSSCFRNCLIIFTILIFLLFLGLASVLAKSGLVNVPILSPLLFKEPKEFVKPDLNAQENLFEKLKQIEEKAKREKKISEEIALQFTQEEILGLMLSFIEKSDLSIDKPQIVIHKDRIETWGRFDIKEIKKNIPFGKFLQEGIWIKVSFLPTATGERVQFEIKQVQIGSLSIPSFLTKKAMDALLAKLNKTSLGFEIKGIKSLELLEERVVIKTAPEFFPQFESQFKK